MSSDKAEWEKTFRRIDRERSQAKYEKDLVRWAIFTSKKLQFLSSKEAHNALPHLWM